MDGARCRARDLAVVVDKGAAAASVGNSQDEEAYGWPIILLHHNTVVVRENDLYNKHSPQKLCPTKRKLGWRGARGGGKNEENRLDRPFVLAFDRFPPKRIRVAIVLWDFSRLFLVAVKRPKGPTSRLS